MSQRIYRSALGKPVDMGSLLLKNENVRAVGNMGVNAKGDVIDKKNTVVNNKNTRVSDQYRKQIQNQVVDVMPGTASVTNTSVPDPVEEIIEGLDTDTPEITQQVEHDSEQVVEEESKNEKKTTTKKKGGLASAIAKAREIEQKKLKTPREESRSKEGVKKL